VSGDQEAAISMYVDVVYCCPQSLGRQTVCLVFVTAVLDSAVLFTAITQAAECWWQKYKMFCTAVALKVS